MRSLMHKSLAVAVLVFAVTFGSTSASAQSSEGREITSSGHRLEGNIAGTVGLGLLGAELGLILTPAFGLQDQLWAWIVLPTVGAAAGAVAGGLTFEPRDPSPSVTLPLFGAGMALLIPAIVGAIAIKDRRRHRDLEHKLDAGGAVRLSKQGASLGVPSVGSAPVYSAAEVQKFGLTQRSSLQISLVSGRF